MTYEAPQGGAGAVMGVEGLKEHRQGRWEVPRASFAFVITASYFSWLLVSLQIQF